MKREDSVHQIVTTNMSSAATTYHCYNDVTATSDASVQRKGATRNGDSSVAENDN